MIKILTRCFIVATIAFMHGSCKQYPKGVQDALAHADHNAGTLMGLMEHYRDTDSLKFQAACFLVENMPFHQSRGTMQLSQEYSRFFADIDSMLIADPSIAYNDSVKKLLAEKFSKLPPPATSDDVVQDINTLSQEFLIDAIDNAFEQWRTSPLLRKMAFDEFKETILPYRAAQEPIMGGKSFYHDLMHSQLATDSIATIYEPVGKYKKYTDLMRKITKQFNAHEHIGPYDIYLPMFESDCANLAAITCNLFRANGIPVVYEFTPQWQREPEGHYWCSSPDSTGRYIPYTPPFNNLGEDWDSDLRHAGKVYRNTYALNRQTPLCLRGSDEYIPYTFASPTLLDVTDNYHDCADISLPADFNHKRKRLAYLAFFNIKADDHINIVGWGNIIGDSVFFKNVPVDMLFFPTFINDNKRPSLFGKPFVLRKNRQSGRYAVEPIPECDESNLTTLHILRKYPHKPHLVKYRRNLQGARLLASNSIDGAYETLMVVDSIADNWKRFKVNTSKAYRYYKMETRDKSPIHIAEYEFLVRNHQGEKHEVPAQLPIFSADCKTAEDTKYQKIVGEPMLSGPLCRNACDNNLDTYIESPWFGMSFTKPVRIDALQLYPRNARNGIEPGNTYQLLYYKDGEWIKHSEKVAEYNYIDFENVPSNTLYWVRNLTSGEEELPFFYIDGKQVFINELSN